jgi:hypothetical protein
VPVLDGDALALAPAVLATSFDDGPLDALAAVVTSLSMVQPGEAPRLPHWGHIGYDSKPDSFHGGLGADTPEEARAQIVEYIRRCGTGHLRVREARICIWPVGGSMHDPPERTIRYEKLDPDWPLTDDQIASLGARLASGSGASRIDILVTFEEV